MKIKTIKVKTYQFDELEKDIQEKVIEKYAYINVDYDEWDDFILEEWTSKLESLGYKDVRIYYTGFYSQGDGACFVAEVEIEKWIKAHKAGRKFQKLLAELKSGCWASITITHSGNYYYSTSTTVNYEGQLELSDKAYGQLEEVARWVEEERENLGKEIYRDLEKEYEYLTSGEAIIETIKANGYKFLKNGEQTIYI